jgi:hypothetical protein
VFRKLADTVDVHFTYQGDHGTVAVTAELSTPSGWHSSVPLAGPTSFTTTRYEGTVRLDLAALAARAAAAAVVTGVPAQPLTVAVVPHVHTADGVSFAPSLHLELSPLQLTLSGGADALRVETSHAVQQITATPGVIHVLRWAISVATARTVSALLLVAGLFAAAVLVLGARRSPPPGRERGDPPPLPATPRDRAAHGDVLRPPGRRRS